MKKWALSFFLIVVLCALLPGWKTQAEAYTSPASSYVVLDDDTKVAWSLQQDLYVDLNGNYLTGTIVTNGYKIFGMDAFTDAYNGDDAGVFSCVDENGSAVVPEPYVKTDHSGQIKRYMTIEENGRYAFHRIYFGITHTSLVPADLGIGFKAAFCGTDAVKDKIQSVGYRLWVLEDYPVIRDMQEFRDQLTLRLKHVDPELYGQMPVYATVFVTMQDGTVMHSAESMVTLRGVVEAVNQNASQFTAQQRDAVLSMVDSHPAMQTWDVSKLRGCQTHEDADNNGYCDFCAENVVITVDLYAVNDLHGKLADGDSHPGVDELSTYFQNARDNSDHMILLSSGDMWQGAAESNLTKGRIITDWMNEMDFVSMTIGNHEFDWGQEFIAQNAELAEFPFLAINIYDDATNARVDYCQSSVVVEAGGIQVGIIGAVGDCYSSISADCSAGVSFITGTQLTQLIKAESERLRSEGVDLIVLSIHDGGTASSGHYDTSLSNGYVDLVFEGHTHQSYVHTDNYGVYHLQGGGDNKGITYASVQYNTVNQNYTVSTAQTVPSSTYSSLEDHPIVQELLDKYDDQINLADQVLGNNRYYRDDSVIEQLVADLYCQAGLEIWGDEYNIVLGGGFIRTRAPYNLQAGQVTYGDLMSLLPFDNKLVLCKIKGTYLKSRFLNNSSQDYYLGFSDYGNSVKNSISSNTIYYVVVDSYTAYYSYNRLTIVEEYSEALYARDLLAQYIKAGNLNK